MSVLCSCGEFSVMLERMLNDIPSKLPNGPSYWVMLTPIPTTTTVTV